MGLMQEYTILAKKEKLSPIQITPFYQKLVDEEVKAIGPDGPLWRGVLPTQERMDLRVKNEVPDFVDDEKNMPIKGLKTVIQKYDNRLLLLLTTNCFAKCQYCFRDNLLNTYTLSIENGLPQIAEYINQHEKIDEIIFSGGDPLDIPRARFEKILEYLYSNTRIRYFRVHTRAAAFAPSIFNKEMIDLLKRYNAKVYHHIIHPYELCKEVVEKINILDDAGIKMYNQFPLLRNINDNSELLIHLLKRLNDLHVTTISLFIADPITYSASFRIPLKRVFRIMDEINWNSSSWVNNIRLVLDTPVGKVRRENVKSWDTNTGVVIFSRAGKDITYQDFPEELDQRGDINRLMWKGWN